MFKTACQYIRYNTLRPLFLVAFLDTFSWKQKQKKHTFCILIQSSCQLFDQWCRWCLQNIYIGHTIKNTYKITKITRCLVKTESCRDATLSPVTTVTTKLASWQLSVSVWPTVSSEFAVRISISFIHLNSLRASGEYMHHQTRPSLVQIMSRRLFGTKPLSEPMLTCCLLEPLEDISVKFEPKYTFQLRNYHLQTGDNFVSAKHPFNILRPARLKANCAKRNTSVVIYLTSFVSQFVICYSFSVAGLCKDLNTSGITHCKTCVKSTHLLTHFG